MGAHPRTSGSARRARHAGASSSRRRRGCAPCLRREGVEVSEADAGRAFAAEIAYYLEHHLEGRDAASLDGLRDRCAAVLGAELGARRSERARGDARVAAVPGLRGRGARARRAARREGMALVVVSNWDCSLPEVLAGAGLLEAGGRGGVLRGGGRGEARPGALPARPGARRGRAPDEALHVGTRRRRTWPAPAPPGCEALLLVARRRRPAGAHSVAGRAGPPNLGGVAGPSDPKAIRPEGPANPPPPDLPELPAGAAPPAPRWPWWFAFAAFLLGAGGDFVLAGIVGVRGVEPARTSADADRSSGRSSRRRSSSASPCSSPRWWRAPARGTSACAGPRCGPRSAGPPWGWWASTCSPPSTARWSRPDVEQTVAEDLGADKGTARADHRRLRGDDRGSAGARSSSSAASSTARCAAASRSVVAALIDGVVFGLLHFSFDRPREPAVRAAAGGPRA